MRKFEYTVLDVPTKGFWGKIDHDSLKSKLNELGAKGWEISISKDTNIQHGSSRTIMIILKRELSH